MRFVIAGAEKVTQDNRDLWMERFGLRIFEGYGATEASPARPQPPFAEQHNGHRPTPASHCHGRRLAPSIDARCSE